ncbi:hypothetical protein AO398_26715 [Methylobacterium sp. GXS13]|uniref:hypothetical protein n=1 Tax=Methylobacterium sp. GXS13 TaxID=1730094 RepID=UPI00071BCC91|nr:hypothetical protein [Methylobacterium sp. GXS13]KST56755.1 hypothetical protein AO398_26715 [Methylobacterium sp. GXS13]
MSKNTSLAVAAALLVSLPVGAAHADSDASFGAANAALLRGYTASPPQLYLSSGGPGAGFLTGGIAAPQRPRAPSGAS